MTAEPRYYAQSLDPEIALDAINSLSRFPEQWVGIVDTESGGIIAYAAPENADRIMSALEPEQSPHTPGTYYEAKFHTIVPGLPQTVQTLTWGLFDSPEEVRAAASGMLGRTTEEVEDSTPVGIECTRDRAGYERHEVVGFDVHPFVITRG